MKEWNLLNKKMSGTRSRIQSQGSQDNSLALNHLRKLFSELTKSTAGHQAKATEEKLYSMLPLFCKVRQLGNYSLKRLRQRFPCIFDHCWRFSHHVFLYIHLLRCYLFRRAVLAFFQMPLISAVSHKPWSKYELLKNLKFLNLPAPKNIFSFIPHKSLLENFILTR